MMGADDDTEAAAARSELQTAPTVQPRMDLVVANISDEPDQAGVAFRPRLQRTGAQAGRKLQPSIVTPPFSMMSQTRSRLSSYSDEGLRREEGQALSLGRPH